MTKQPIFNGVKVIELASVLAGPSVGQFLSELGAEVIKVENPKTKGDVTRGWKISEEKTDDRSTYFISTNWNKKSIAIDYSKQDGLEILYKLISQADIVIVSFKPGDAIKLKVDYGSLKSLNEKLIYGVITGYGDYNDRVGYDAVIQAESGFMSINGEKGGNPLKLPVALMDILAAHHLKEAILVAYIGILKGETGQMVSVSLIDSAIASLANQATNWLVGGVVPQQSGSLHPNIAPYGEVLYSKDDKPFILAIGTDQQFERLLIALQIEPSDDFATNEKRLQSRDALNELLSTAFKKLKAQKLQEILINNNIPGGVINNIPEALNQYSNLVVHKDAMRAPRNFSAKIQGLVNASHFLPPPKFGEHTYEILSTHLALNDDQIADLRYSGVVV
ncbi:CoA transferase [Fulvivirga sp. RKSG066]|uniref:CaiB/BaiF CoA transferase family protein n=1 Tax=Fulvivirga aurantia TaxID=2529383 RepID=UPI0012BCA317|nr:CaiB/BaiF CoA-transferase family protein [Fulvivirga aurantia]MTI20222.1 CoA transferase [Fulvivirga aurantia]